MNPGQGQPTSSPSAHATGPLTWQAAKASTQATELAIARQIDASEVANISQQKTGTLLSCSDSTWQWTGDTTVTMKTPSDPKFVLDDLEKHWSGQDGFNAKLTTSQSDGRSELLIGRGATETYIVAPTNDHSGFDISSFSDCFKLAPSDDPGARY
ncbi:MAG: hypothetical protein FWD85_03280 [Microbacteriaceae bacterium]|nr:hypothetical protein [Microbacteriaceae bacterium]